MRRSATARVIPIRRRNATSREKSRNARVRRVGQLEWRRTRMSKFSHATKFAAAAKAVRTALELTQEELARSYGVSQFAVSHWESGTYFGWTEDELNEYIDRCRKIASR